MARPRILLPCAALAGLAAACGGGGAGSGAPATGLEPPAHLALVEPLAPPASGTTGPPLGQVLPPDSDYATDAVDVRVHDAADQPLATIDAMLCLLRRTGAAELVNRGPYRAQIDAVLCQEGEDTSSLRSRFGQSSGTTEYRLWTVDSTRGDDASPQVVRLWFPDTDPDDGVGREIRAEVRIDAAPGPGSPFGSFRLDLAAVDPAAPDVQDPIARETLETVDSVPGEVGYTYYQERGDVDAVAGPGESAERIQVSVRAAADQSSGQARLLVTRRSDTGGGDSGPVTDEYLVAFDETHLLRQIDDQDPVLYSRESPDERVWRYDLYYADGDLAGQRVERDAGFGFRTLDGDYGTVGYTGLWVPDGVTVSSGETVVRDVYGEPGEAVDYTLEEGGGKLLRLTRRMVSLDAVVGRPFRWTELDPVTGAPTPYLITYDGASWVRTQRIDPDSLELTDIVPPTGIDTASLGYLSMWSDGLGGPAAWRTDVPTVVTYYEETLESADSDLFAGGGTARLYGLVSCLGTELTGAEVEAGNVFLPDASSIGAPYLYELHQDDLTLYQDVNGDGSVLERVGLADGEAPTTGLYTWGLQSGPLVTDTAGLTDVRDVWGLDGFYVYETGPNDWNRAWVVRDPQNAVVHFDPPLQFAYTHAAASDRNGDATLDGRTYLLSYDGPGRLRGLPRQGVDLDGDGVDDRFYPVLSLADGTLVGPTGTEYVVRGRVVEEVLAPDPGASTGLDLTAASDLVLPDGSTYRPPAIGDAPAVTDPPRVIDGAVVGGSN